MNPMVEITLASRAFVYTNAIFALQKCLLGCAQSPSFCTVPMQAARFFKTLLFIYGCVRVTNSDQLAIQNVLNNQSQKTGVLEIIERDT